MKRLFAIAISSLFLLAGCNLVTYHYDNSEMYTKYTEPVGFVIYDEDLKSINVDWISGEVIIKKGDTSEFTETNIQGSYLPCYYYLNGLDLNIKYCASGTSSIKSGHTKKKLEITCRASVETIKIKTVSADYSVEMSGVNDLVLDTVSGDGTIKVNYIDHLDLDSTSGDLTLEAGTLNSATMDTVSGDVKVDVTNTKQFDFDSTSGALRLIVRESTLIKKIKFSAVSGGAKMYFDGLRGYNLDFSSTSGDKTLNFKDGPDTLPKFDIEFDSTSGDLLVDLVSAL